MTEPIFRPMKGEKVSDEDLPKIYLPVWLSAKLDGWRCLVKNQRALTAKLEPIPNRFVRSILERPEYEGFDGELLLMRKDAKFSEIQSALLSEDGEPDFVYHVFDLHNMDGASFDSRLAYMRQMPHPERVKLVGHIRVETLEQFRQVEAVALSRGFEGVMARRGDLPYKFGKASIKQGHLLKRKPMANGTSECECIIVGFEEGMTNNNEATKDERGLTKRSSAKSGKVPNGRVGKILVRNTRFGDFKLGPGKAGHEMLRDMLQHPEKYLHKFANFTFQEMGTEEKPRIPTFQHIRDERDMEPELVRELRSLVGGSSDSPSAIIKHQCGPSACDHDYSGYEDIVGASGAVIGGTAVCTKCGCTAYDEAAWN